MFYPIRLIRFSALLALAVHAASFAEEEVTSENVVAPTENSPDEPIAASMSLQQTAHFLDSASLNWQNQRKCMTCHTNYAYLYARPALSSDTVAHKQVRDFAEKLVTERWEEKGPRWDAEVVATAAALAFNDAVTTGKLHPATRTALERMWTVQQEDGSWSWLKCDWPPMESDDHYGVTVAAIAVGVAPEEYALTDAATQGMQKLRSYLKANPPPTLHHKAMVMWADSYSNELMSKEERQQCIEELIALQKEDGGWALATLGNWERMDDLEQDLTNSDGYGTAFVLYALRRGGVAADLDAIQRGVKWLKSNQRESGRWFTRSLSKDSRHFISHAGTAMAVMALNECGQLKSDPAAERINVVAGGQ